MLAPAAGTSPRYSIPFFQNIKQDLRLSEHVLQCVFFPLQVLLLFLPFFSFFGACGLVPPEVLKLKGRRGELGKTDCESGYPKSSQVTD